MKNLKDIGLVVFIVVLSFVLTFLFMCFAVAFVLWDFNISNWGFLRLIIMLASAWASFTVFMFKDDIVKLLKINETGGD